MDVMTIIVVDTSLHSFNGYDAEVLLLENNEKNWIRKKNLWSVWVL